MEITGILKVKYDTSIVSEKFKKRDFVLTTEASSLYPQHVSMQLTQDKVTLLNNVKIGDEVKVLFNLKGREWTSPQGETKYFNTIDAWRIELVQNSAQPSFNEPVASKPQEFVPNNSIDDDLPF